MLAAFTVFIDSVSNASILQLCYFQDLPVDVIHVSFIGNLWFHWCIELLWLEKTSTPLWLMLPPQLKVLPDHECLILPPLPWFLRCWFSAMNSCQMFKSTCAYACVCLHVYVHAYVYSIYVCKCACVFIYPHIHIRV